MQEKLLSGRLASICSPTRRFWEKVNFGFVPDIYKKSSTGYCCQHGMCSYGSVPIVKNEKQFPHKEIFMWILVFCMLFNGGTVPWYITMRSYHLMDSIWGLVLGTGLQVFNVILAVNFLKIFHQSWKKHVLLMAADRGGI